MNCGPKPPPEVLRTGRPHWPSVGACRAIPVLSWRSTRAPHAAAGDFGCKSLRIDPEQPECPLRGMRLPECHWQTGVRNSGSDNRQMRAAVGPCFFRTACWTRTRVISVGHAGCLPEVVQRCHEQRLGMVQMPCPEQQAWGGVLKPMLLRAYGLRHRSPMVFIFRWALLAVFRWRTQRVYRRLARQVAIEVADYLASGMDVQAVVGVDGSPSCGISTTTDLGMALERVTVLAPSRFTPTTLNHKLEACLTVGDGMSAEELRRDLRRRRIEVPFTAHDLPGELAASAASQAAMRST